MGTRAKGRTGHTTGSVEARNPRRGLRRAGSWLLVLLAIPVGISGAVVARSDAAASWQPRDPSVQADWPTVATPEDADPRQVA